MAKYPLGRQIAGCAVALASIPVQMLFLGFGSVVLGQSVFITLLYAWAGPAAAALAFLASAGALGLMFGSGGLAAAVALFGLPAIAAIVLLERRAPYFARMRLAMLVQFGAIVLVMVACYAALQENLADVLARHLRGALDAQPPEMRAAFMDMMARIIVLPDNLLEGGWTAWAEYIENTFATLLKLGLPGMLITTSVVTGVLMTSLSSGVCVRRGDDPQVPHVPLPEWFVPNRVTLGALASYAAAWLMNAGSVSGADALLNAMASAVTLVFTLQASAGLARVMKMRGYSRMGRNMMLGLALLFGTVMMQLAGAFISILGRRGIVTEFLRKHKQDDGEGGGR